MVVGTSPFTARLLPVDILTSGYRVVGKVATTSAGIMGMLNDNTHSAMEVQDARMARLHMPTKLVDHFEVVRIMKRQVHVLVLARREDLGPLSMVHGSYTKVNEYPARITTQVFEIEGTLELPGRFDIAALMSDVSREFMPVFNATLTAILLPNLRVESPGMLINRSKLDLIGLIGQRVKPEK